MLSYLVVNVSSWLGSWRYAALFGTLGIKLLLMDIRCGLLVKSFFFFASSMLIYWAGLQEVGRAGGFTNFAPHADGYWPDKVAGGQER